MLRITACVAGLTLLVLVAAGSALAVTITSAGTPGSATSGAGVNARNVATAANDPYCSGTYFVINGSGFVYDSANPDPVKGAVTSISIGNVPAAWYKVGADNVMYALVGKGATTGPIVVTTPAGTFSTDSLPGGRINSTDTSAQGQLPGVQIVPCVSQVTVVKPTISGFHPKTVKHGKKTTINGSGFTGVTSVTIGGKAAVFAVVQDVNMVVVVPSTAKAGTTPVVVTNSAGSTTSSLKVT
jgi:hypothetical protein